MHRNPFYLLAILSITLHCVTGLYFHLAEGERKCFIEEVPSDTMVTSELILLMQIHFIQNIHEMIRFPINFKKLIKHSIFYAAHYKIELYDSRSGGFAPPSLGKYQSLKSNESIRNGDLMQSINLIFNFIGIGMHVEVKDPDDKEILSRVYSAEGMSNVEHLRIVRGTFIMNNYLYRFFFHFRKIPIHITHSGRTHHLLVFKHIAMV